MFQLDTAPERRVMGHTQSHLYPAPHPVLGGCVAHLYDPGRHVAEVGWDMVMAAKRFWPRG